jgi:hypothetical protein
LFEAPNETPSDLAFVAPFEVVRAEFLVRRLVVQDVIRSGQHGGRDGENGFLGSATTLEAEELWRDVVDLGLVVQHDAEQCVVDREATRVRVFNQAELPELVHEEVHT